MRQPPEFPEGTVTVLFTDLVGSTRLNQALGDEGSGAIEREIEGVALERFAKHRGIVAKDMGDGFMVVFQSARRAVACAREIQRELARRNRETPHRSAQMRIGLHTGEVLEENGGLRGETVIIAKRVESLAPAGGIFASETTHGVLGTARGELQDRGEFELKGIDLPWRLYEVPWAREEVAGVLPPGERSPFVGRSAERERLARLAERAKEGTGALIFLAGEAGVGKTRLAQELAERARAAGFLVLTGRCVDMEGAEPYLPLIEQIEQAGREVPPELLRQALGENAPEVAKLIPELRQRYADIPEPASMPPEQERRYLLHGVEEFVERAARGRPLLLVFEDLHWADESTLLLLRHLARRVREIPVLLLGTYRHLELESHRPFAGVLPDLIREHRMEEVLLTRLDPDGVAALLEGRAGRRPPRELVDLVHAETDGNPFFVEEVFRHLHEAGKLFDEAGSFRAGIDIADTEVPRGVSLVIGRRLERVSETTRRVLTAAALVGRTFRFDLLRPLVSADEDELLDAVEEATHATLLEDASVGREARYAFVHEQVRQTLLSTLSTARRQRLHLRIADALEKLYGSEVEERAVDVAHHLSSAGAAADADRTARYLVLAGERARAALAFEDALRHFDAARTIAPPGDRGMHARILRLRALALRGAARMDEALAAFAEALGLAPEGSDTEQIRYERAQLQLDLFRGREAIEDLEALLARARDARDEKRELDLLLALGRAHYVLSLDRPGYAQAARESYERAYARAKELGDRRAMAMALIPTVWFTDYWPAYREQAKANLAEACALAEQLGDEDLAIDCSISSQRLLSPGEVRAREEEIRERLEARRDPVRLKEHYFRLMWTTWWRAELERCLEVCDAGIALSERLGSEPVQYPTIKALALMDLGRLDEAWRSLEAEVADDDHRFGRAMQQLGVAVYLEQVGALAGAVERARAVLGEARALHRTWMQSWLVGLLTVLSARTRDPALWAEVEEISSASGFRPSRLAAAERRLAEGELEEALRLAREGARGAERAGMRRAQLVGLELVVRVLADLGRSSEAASLAQALLVQTGQTGFRALEWRVRASRARALRDSGDPDGAERERVAARAILREIATRIPDPEHRACFETDPVAAELLAAGEAKGDA